MSIDASTRLTATEGIASLDVAIIGAGLGGMYSVHCLRAAGLNVRAFDEASGVGGTWHWTRYPGARVDFPGGPFYCYTFSEELVREFDWPHTQPDQPTVLRYCNFVADKLDLRRDIQLNTRVTSVTYEEASQRWYVETDRGEIFRAQFVVCATGSLSAVNSPSFPGLETFQGLSFHTARWPSDVSLAGKRVGVIGTGSSAVQAIPEIAEEAAHLTVFQRTPQFVVPAGNRDIDPETKRHARENWPEIRNNMLNSKKGSPFPQSSRSALDDTLEQREQTYEYWWKRGSQGILSYSYGDLMTSREANKTLSDFVRRKIAQIVRDKELAKKLMPEYDIGGKRLILGTNYFETYNRDNVTLVDLQTDRLLEVTPTGVRTESGHRPLDVLVLGTGFDAITGALLRLNVTGRDGLGLKDKWSDHFSTYLGMGVRGFPNLFMINGPQTPSVLWNMPFAAELEGDWVRDCIVHMRRNRIGAIEPAEGSEESWEREVRAAVSGRLYTDNDSWFMGSNIPGKPRQFTIHLDGPGFFKGLSRVAAEGYPGFELEAERPRIASALPAVLDR